MSECFLVETRRSNGQWEPVNGTGSSIRRFAERTRELLVSQMPAFARHTAPDLYRVARYVRDDDEVKA